MLKSSANDSCPRIAVAGATGRVGSALIASLVSEPLDLVALTRNPGAQRVPSDVSLAVDRGASRDSRHRLITHRPHYM